MADISIPIKREDLEAKRKLLLSSQGVDIQGDKSEIDHDGIKIGFEYVNEVLNVDILKVPFKYKMFKWKIEKEIRDWFAPPENA